MQDSTNFTPNENQQAVLAAVQEADYGISITEACSTAGIHRTTYYTWFEDSGFRDWWAGKCDRWFTLRLPAVAAAMYKGAVNKDAPGNVGAQKLFLERFDRGYAPRSRQEIGVESKLDWADIVREMRAPAGADRGGV